MNTPTLKQLENRCELMKREIDRLKTKRNVAALIAEQLYNALVILSEDAKRVLEDCPCEKVNCKTYRRKRALEVYKTYIIDAKEYCEVPSAPVESSTKGN